MFSISTALARLNNLEQPVFTPGLTAAQQLQIVNRACDRLWTFGSWEGLLDEVTDLTTSGGILTLPQAYRFLTGLRVCNPQGSGGPCGTRRVFIKSQQWKYSPSSEQDGGFDWNQLSSIGAGAMYAFDMGDGTAGGPVDPSQFSAIVLQDEATGTWYWVTVNNQIITLQNPSATPPAPGTTVYDPVSGNYYTVVIQNQVIGLVLASSPTSPTAGRQYRISGDPAYIDTLTFNGIAKLRYVYATSTAAIVIPDCFEALMMAVQSLHSYSTGDTTRAEEEFKTALNILEEDSEAVVGDEDMGCLSLDPMTSGGGFLNVI